MTRKRAPIIRPMSPDLAREQAIQDLRAVCATSAGRRVAYAIINETRVWDAIRAPSPDIHYNEGRRSVGIWMMEWIDATDPTLIPMMMQESRNADLSARQDTTPSNEDDA